MRLFFTKNLLLWNKNFNQRKMPWKGEKDPYKIWLSEIILQQTRVEQGWNYYLKFIESFPTVQQLANTPETTIYKLWEGLGYYSRCKNLIAAARIIDKVYNGRFPAAYSDILNLPGIGPYTAAAISSFAFNLPYAVVDGNVTRVLSRIEGITTPADSAKGKKVIIDLANELLDKKQPGVYNQAIMDFGAVICKPKAPCCPECIMKKNCKAYQLGIVAALPFKEKKIIKKNRWLYYFIIKYKNKVYIRKRTDNDIWQNLHEFYLIEKDRPSTKKNWLQSAALKQLFFRNEATITHVSKIFTQQLTHQKIHGQFIEISVKNLPELGADFKAVACGEIDNYPFPKFMITYLKEKNVNLSQQ